MELDSEEMLELMRYSFLRLDGAWFMASAEKELFWIAVEAFNNVVKHANARQVQVRLLLDEGSVCLEIEDDGAGFEPARAGQSGGLGLRGMEERVQRIQGRLKIASVPGRGTTVRVEIKV